MKQIDDFLQETASAVIAELPAEFTTRQFIWQFADAHEHAYIEMLLWARKDDQSRVFHSLHSHMGNYLSNHSKELAIIKLNQRKIDVNPFGRKTESQLWQKVSEREI